MVVAPIDTLGARKPRFPTAIDTRRSTCRPCDVLKVVRAN
jgi:hypothetical protein